MKWELERKKFEENLEIINYLVDICWIIKILNATWMLNVAWHMS